MEIGILIVELCSRHGDDAVEKDLEQEHVGSRHADVEGVFDSAATKEQKPTER